LSPSLFDGRQLVGLADNEVVVAEAGQSFHFEENRNFSEESNVPLLLRPGNQWRAILRSSSITKSALNQRTFWDTHQKSGLDMWIGADPGGTNAFGLAILDDDGRFSTHCLSCAEKNFPYVTCKRCR